MDADLQDPPEVVLALISRWREGYDIVHARRRSRAGETRFKLWTAKLFYRGINALSDVELPADVGDFRLVSRRAIETFRAMPEQDHYVRGMFAWMGYRQAFVEFDREERRAGETKYPFRRMLKLALNGIVSFSDVPLRMAIWAGSIISLGALAYGAWVIFMWLTGVGLVTGWASLAVLVSLLSGINLLVVGIVGIYVGRIHREVKGRPRYIVARDTAEQAAAISADLFPRGSIGERLLKERAA
jgi:dolichol-phosphate mannosyltransferase